MIDTAADGKLLDYANTHAVGAELAPIKILSWGEFLQGAFNGMRHAWIREKSRRGYQRNVIMSTGCGSIGGKHVL
jgi:hypothetical protein